jgi:hypothetical protein
MAPDLWDTMYNNDLLYILSYVKTEGYRVTLSEGDVGIEQERLHIAFATRYGTFHFRVLCVVNRGSMTARILTA